MSDHDKNKELEGILDSLGKEVLDSSEDEVMQLYKEAGLNADEGVERIRNTISESVNAFKRKAIKATRLSKEKENKFTQGSLSKIPKIIKEQRALLEEIFNRPNAPEALTLSFREGKDIPDEDLKDLLGDLEALGLLDD